VCKPDGSTEEAAQQKDHELLTDFLIRWGLFTA
jgi:hypothetical protein